MIIIIKRAVSEDATISTRGIKFLRRCYSDNLAKQQTQTYQPNDDDDDFPQRDLMKNPKSEEFLNKQLSVGKQTNTKEDSHSRHLGDSVTNAEEGNEMGPLQYSVTTGVQ